MKNTSHVALSQHDRDEDYDEDEDGDEDEDEDDDDDDDDEEDDEDDENDDMFCEYLAFENSGGDDYGNVVVDDSGLMRAMEK